MHRVHESDNPHLQMFRGPCHSLTPLWLSALRNTYNVKPLSNGEGFNMFKLLDCLTLFVHIIHIVHFPLKLQLVKLAPQTGWPAISCRIIESRRGLGCTGGSTKATASAIRKKELTASVVAAEMQKRQFKPCHTLEESITTCWHPFFI